MSSNDHILGDPTAIRTDLAAIFISLELSRRTWLVTSLLPGSEKMSRHAIGAGAAGDLLALLGRRRAAAEARSGCRYRIVAIQEAGLDGFWRHRVLEAEGVESHVVDAASIAAPAAAGEERPDRRGEPVAGAAGLQARRAAGVLDGAAAEPGGGGSATGFARAQNAGGAADRAGQPHRGLLFSQGVFDYEPRRRRRRERLDALRTGGGRALPEHLKRQLGRELERLELVEAQIKQVEAERDALLAAPQDAAPEGRKSRLTQ